MVSGFFKFLFAILYRNYLLSKEGICLGLSSGKQEKQDFSCATLKSVAVAKQAPPQSPHTFSTLAKRMLVRRTLPIMVVSTLEENIAGETCPAILDI